MKLFTTIFMKPTVATCLFISFTAHYLVISIYHDDVSKSS